MKKYELVNYNKETNLWQIKALRSFRDVVEGDLGGWVESDKNLSHEGKCWIYGDAKVYGNAEVSGKASVYENAKVSGDAWVYGKANIFNGNITKTSDYIVLKNVTTSGRYFTYNFTSDCWAIGCFQGNTEKLQKHLESANEMQQKEYNIAIIYVDNMKEILCLK